jgi:glucose/arabinose dehydrogenase
VAQLDPGPTSFRLTPVGRADRPVQVLIRTGETTRWVVEQRGTLRQLTAAGNGPLALDVRREVSTGNEQGLLGAAFSGDGSLLYVNLTDADGDTEIREYRWLAATRRADPASSRLLLRVEQPYANHNGGGLHVDSQGLLWIALGDGGSAGDPKGSGQDRRSLLGKILRIDPRPAADGSAPYRIPPGNPWADGREGRPEVWAWGLRNPWRFEVDEAGGRVVIGDVGQNEVEELDVVPLDAMAPNFGWNRREGTRPFRGGERPDGAVDPVWEAAHDDGWCSITGGITYRGRALPALRGRHVFGDFCQGELMALERATNTSWRAYRLNVAVKQPSSFALDADGELLVTSLSGRVYRLVAR